MQQKRDSLRRLLLLALIAVASLFTTHSTSVSSDPRRTNTQVVRLGFIGSLSSFAAHYGAAVLEGARLAVDELKHQGVVVELRIEDDQSIAKNSVNAYVKLKTVDHVSGIIGGTWWANSIVKQAERDRIPLLSCETLYNDDAVLGDSYFILHGDLRDWVRVYAPLIRQQEWKNGAIIRYVSGFGTTLAREMESLFSQEGRKFAGAIEYGDINMSDTSDIVMKLRRLNPDVVYIDAQPGGLANLLKKLSEAGMTRIPIITHSIADTVRRDKLFDMSHFKSIYFTQRSTFDDGFARKFKEKYGKDAYLNSDLGYYSVYLLMQAMKSSDAISRIKQGMTAMGKRFTFDEHNVFSGAQQEVFKIEGNNAVKWSP